MIETNNLVLEHQPQEGKFLFEGHKYPRFVDIPSYLIRASNEFGIERAEFVEIRVMNILKWEATTIDYVMRHNFGSLDDQAGHDLTVFFKEGCDQEFVHVQVKASGDEISEYKQFIKRKYFENTPNGDELVGKWLTDHKIILINGAETKTAQEILNHSFYPQLERINQKFIKEKSIKSPNQLAFFPDIEEVQIFSEAA